MPAEPISRFEVPDLSDLPADIRERIIAVQEKSGFVPNVFLALSHRPEEFRAFFAHHDALMDKEEGLSDVGAQRLHLLRRCTRRHFAHSSEKPAHRRSDCRQLS